MFASPDCTAIAPARIVGSTFSTSAFTSSWTSNFTVLLLAITAVALCWPRYSTIPGYISAQTFLNSGPLDVTSGFASRISTLERGFAALK